MPTRRPTFLRGASTRLWSWCAALLLALPGSLRADEGDPALAARVGALIALLEDPSFAARERASAELFALGAAAGPFLLPLREHPDLEVRARVRAIVARLGLLAPEEEAALARALDQLWGAPAVERQAALDRAMAVSFAAHARVEAALAWPATAVLAELHAPVRWIRAGAAWPAPWKLRLTNALTRNVLVPPAHNRTRTSQSLKALVPPRPGPIGGRFGGGLVRRVSGTIDVLQNATVLTPGASCDVEPWVSSASKEFVGWRNELGVFDVRAEVVAGGRVLAIGPPGTDAATGSVSASTRVLVLPDSAAPVEVAGVSLSIALAAPRVGANEALAFELVLSNRGAAARLDADWARYTWVALVPKDPTAACAARAATAAALAGAPEVVPEARTPLDLAPGATLRGSGTWKDLVPGTYLLIAAYEDPATTEAGYLVGRIVAREVEVLVVEASAK